MTNKQKYTRFLEHEYVPVFYRPWYLDAVCDSPWDVIIEEEDGEICGVMTYMIKKKYGFRYIIHPRLCPYMGPLFFGKVDSSEVYQKMLLQLPSHHYREQKYGPLTARSVLPGTSEEKVTYMLSTDEHDDLDISNLRARLRTKIRKAKKTFTRRDDVSIEELLVFLDRTFAQRNRENPYDRDTLIAIDSAAQEHSCRSIVAYRDEEGRDMAMGFFLTDEHCVYNMATAVDSSTNHNAVSLLLWETAGSAIRSGKTFDFEGSSIPAIERLYRSFGGERYICPSTSYVSNRIVKVLVDLKIKKNRSS